VLDPPVLSSLSRKVRAAEIKALLKEAQFISDCEEGLKEIERLKEEQYKLSRYF
jgi:hypothetical protein